LRYRKNSSQDLDAEESVPSQGYPQDGGTRSPQADKEVAHMADWVDEETDNVRTTEKWTTARK
jgi:hypothetical protein